MARHRAGRTVIVATHDPVALEYVDRVIALEDAGVDTQPVRVGVAR